MDNPSSFNYDSISPSSLTTQNIIMMGRAKDAQKRFDLGIKVMKIIVKFIPKCEMNLISFPSKKIEKLIKNLHLEKNVRFVGYQKNVEKYLKNSSLHILTSIAESYSMALGETKIFGIPSIIVGLDYLALSKGGSVIIYDDNPNIIAHEVINILKNHEYRQFLGKQARKVMKNHNNKIIIKRWVKLLLSIYRGNSITLNKMMNEKKIISEKEAEQIIRNQLILLKKRRPFLKNLTIEQLKNYSLMQYI